MPGPVFKPKLVYLQGHERQIGAVTGPVAELAGPEVTPEIPLRPLAVIRTEDRRAKPQVPIKMIGHSFLAGRFLAVGATTSVPDMHILYPTDSPITDEF